MSAINQANPDNAADLKLTRYRYYVAWLPITSPLARAAFAWDRSR